MFSLVSVEHIKGKLPLLHLMASSQLMVWFYALERMSLMRDSFRSLSRQISS